MTTKPDKYALLHVADRTGIIEFAYELRALGFHIISTGATAKALKQAELEVLEVREFIKTPDLLEGQLGLLHPRILLAVSADRDKAGQMHELERRGGLPIDLLAVNFYPVSEIILDKNLTQTDTLDYIDLAGSALLRAAARNHRHLICLCDPDDYQPTIDSLKQYSRLHPERRQSLAAKAFHYSAYYDSTVAQYLGGKWERLPDELVIGLKKTSDLRYGENPQQQGALYTLSGSRPWGINAARILYGKPLSYNHYLDIEAAWELAIEIENPACAIVRHAVPAGVASSENLAEAARLAYRSDPRGCFQGTCAVNREISGDAAAFFAEAHIGLIVAPQFSPQALSLLRAKKDIRLVTLPAMLVAANEIDLRTVAGGVLLQDKDHSPMSGPFHCVTKKSASETEMKSLQLAWHVAKHARTHAAIIVQGASTVGIGSGQTSRLDSVRLALVKSQERHPILPASLPLLMASDGALSGEHVREAAQAGVAAIIQPGGSSEDKDAIEAADEKGIVMLFTGARHFRH
jgi:phosphoribosylaminoimidazolecarboxamide formyltransferase/IMP cyclohydrolase